jgi:hypothetical protein
MNLLHAIRRALSMPPARREGERNARSTAELVEMIRHDALYGRRHDDVTDVGAVRDAAERARKTVTRVT